MKSKQQSNVSEVRNKALNREKGKGIGFLLRLFLFSVTIMISYIIPLVKGIVTSKPTSFLRTLIKAHLELAR